MHVIDSFSGPNRFLSNFYRHTITFGDISFPTNEHAFAAWKTTDWDQRRAIAEASGPKEAKAMGRRLALREGWDEMSSDVMRLINATKYADGALRMALLTTGDALLVEGNIWHDNTWGDCFCGRPACRSEGENRLGQILMSIRSDLFLEFS